MSEELKPCPFCGGDAGKSWNGNTVLTEARCRECGTKWMPVDVWNTRAESPELIAARAEVERLTTTVDTLAKHLRAVTDSRHDMERNFRRANVVVAQQAAEIERLKQCLKAANANHEKFERLWYLEQDKNAQQAAEIQRLTGLLNGNPEEGKC